MFIKSLFINVIALILLLSGCGIDKSTPLRVVSELNIGETQNVKLSNGEIIKLSLLGINEVRDSIRNAIREAEVMITVDGQEATLNFGNYNLPVEVGKVQIDCPAIKSLLSNAHMDFWSLTKDAIFRLWPKGSPFIQPGTFVYPLKQKWFASKTSAGNEPNGDSDPNVKSIYYHAGFDIGGVEGINEIVSATDGLIVSAKGKTLDDYKDLKLRGMGWKDAIYILDHRGWFILYAHLNSVDTLINAGEKVKKRQRIGFIGKQGTSGGWVHLHFDIRNRDNFSGKFWVEDAYVYAWEAYVRQYKPALVAVARPHRLVWTEQETVFDGTRSRSFEGTIVKYDWQFSDGTSATGPVQKKSYNLPGEYSEILKVTDSKGNIDYDFATVEVADRKNPGVFPYIHAGYYPSLGIKPGDQVHFRIRTFFRGDVLKCITGEETWDFGDGTPTAKTRSVFDPKNQTGGEYAETVHSYSKPGHYIVRVERSNACGFRTFTHLHVEVE
jgi:murein DD-endopeptidase MepM/ murein hydrolase activator NlpD